MSVLVIVDFKAKPENFEDLNNWFKNELHHTRATDGCIGVTVHRNQDNPNNVVIVETWDSRSHYEKYLGWRAERGDVDVLTAWLAEEPTFSYLDNLGV